MAAALCMYKSIAVRASMLLESYVQMRVHQSLSWVLSSLRTGSTQLSFEVLH